MPERIALTGIGVTVGWNATRSTWRVQAQSPDIELPAHDRAWSGGTGDVLVLPWRSATLPDEPRWWAVVGERAGTGDGVVELQVRDAVELQRATVGILGGVFYAEWWSPPAAVAIVECGRQLASVHFSRRRRSG